MSFPRVLIFGQPFNDFSGGGITLTNLFRGWPRDKIAVTFIGHGLISVTTDVCDTYYQLGSEEHKWIFPFNIIQRKFPSGIKTYVGRNSSPVNIIQVSSRYKIVNRFFYPFLKKIGLFHAVSTITLSDKIKQWLKEWRPEILYIQASTRETINFAREINDFLGVPSVIHVMDDWPSTISNSGILKNYWFRRIDREYRELLFKVNLHLSISDSMSLEFEKRYGVKFIPFHNPVELGRWTGNQKKDLSIDLNNVNILYSGRIGRDLGVADSLMEVAEAIDHINSKGGRIRFCIQTPSRDENLLNELRHYSCITMNPLVPYDKIPEVFSGVDILLLANDFSERGINYLRFSMPTKVSEYMISGTPVLVYASGELAVSGFFSNNNCGLCVKNRDKTELVEAIEFMINNHDYRKEISKNAMRIAGQNFDVVRVKSSFQDLITGLYTFSQETDSESGNQSIISD